MVQAAPAFGETFDHCASAGAAEHMVNAFAALEDSNVPVVVLGEVAAQKLPLKWVRAIAAALFLSLGVIALFWPQTPR